MEILAGARRSRVDLYRRGVICSPLLPLGLPLRAGGIYLKLENLQPIIRCYKLRGALNAVRADNQDRLQTQYGVVTASAGNFAQGLALSCQMAKVPLTVLMPRGASLMKAQRIVDLYPEVRIIEVADTQWWTCMLDASTCRTDLPRDLHRARFISPCTDPQVIEGNATIGLEIAEAACLEEATELHLMVPYGGGGLLTGAGTLMRAVFSARPKTNLKIFACEVDTAAPLHASLAQGVPTPVAYRRSFIDGIGAPAVLPQVFLQAKELVDASLMVSPQEVVRACAFLLNQCGMVVEGAGAVSLAAAWRYGTPAAHTVCIVSGGNVTLQSLRDAGVPA